ncbi:hypothetical protein KQI84_17155 [bacterium]|nr:hypothetical protein [bacterium]
MNGKHLLLAAGVTLLAGAASAQSTIAENYETHNWVQWFGDAPVVGYDGTHTTEGSSALHLQFNPASGLAAVKTSEFLPEVGTGLSTGFTADVYVSGGTSGVPMFKLEMNGESGSAESGADTALTLDSWTQVTIPSGNVVENYKEFRLIIPDNGATGVFDIWVDNIQREGALWDGFEQDNSSSVVPANVDGFARGDATVGGSVLTSAGPAPTEGSLLWAMEFSGDSNGDVEIQHFYSTPLDLSGYDDIAFDLYIPSGTTLPVASAFFWDGAAGSFHTGPTISANDAWETVSLDITGLVPAGDEASIDELKIVLGGIGAAGKVFLDNTVYTNSVPVVNSIVRDDVTPTSASSVTFTVSFDEYVNGVDSTDFAFAAGAPTGASVTNVDPAAGPAQVYTVTVDTGTGDGDLGLNVVDDDTIQDLSGLALGGTGTGNGDFTGEVYAIDKAAPGLASGGLAPDSGQADPTDTLPVLFTVLFDEPVNGFDENAIDFTGSTEAGSLSAVVTLSTRGETGPYTVSVSGATVEGDIVIGIVDGLLTDDAGNAFNSGGATASVHYNPLAGVNDWMQFEY